MSKLGTLGQRIYSGEVSFDFVGKRKIWYLVTLLLLILTVASFAIRGFNFGIEFEGGNSFQLPKTPGLTLQQAEDAVASTGVEVTTGQEVGAAGGGGASYLIRTEGVDDQKSAAITKALADKLNVPLNQVSDNRVSASWGGQITQKALIALAVFLVLLIVYLAIRYEWRMAIGAIAALAHDLLITAGVYSLVGFEVSPSTVIGFLSILGFSLYDTVVVFDKVAENSKGILGGSRMTYSEAANLGINQTLARSINTSVIALLPIAALLFIGAGILGAGTLKDLGLVLFIGMAAGTYSSIFLAVPVVAQIKEREPRYQALRKRVLARRAGAKRGTRSDELDADVDSTDVTDATESTDSDDAEDTGRPSSSVRLSKEDESEPAVAAASTSARTSAADRAAAQRKRSGGKPGRPSGKRRS